MNDKILVAQHMRQVLDLSGAGRPTLLDARWVLGKTAARRAALNILFAEIQQLDPKPDIFVGIGARGVAWANALAVILEKELGLEINVSEARKNNASAGDISLRYEARNSVYETVAVHKELLDEVGTQLGRPSLVMVVDDRLATGRTASAVVRLLKRNGNGVIAFSCIACQPLGGVQELQNQGVSNIFSVVNYKLGQPGAHLEIDENSDALKGSGVSVDLRSQSQGAFRRECSANYPALPPGAKPHIIAGPQR